jgi:hypothetical protein
LSRYNGIGAGDEESPSLWLVQLEKRLKYLEIPSDDGISRYTVF